MAYSDTKCILLEVQVILLLIPVYRVVWYYKTVPSDITHKAVLVKSYGCSSLYCYCNNDILPEKSSLQSTMP